MQAQKAKEAARVLMKTGTLVKNEALKNIAGSLIKNQDLWLEANEEDMKNARKSGMSKAMLDRLLITTDRIGDIARGVIEVSKLPDPTAIIDEGVIRPNGLKIIKKRVPIGVIAIIYEARPNVTVDAAVLCLKSGNACILKGGKEAINSNRAAVKIMQEALEKSGLMPECISLVQDTGRETATELMHLSGYVDVLIPRGGAGLIKNVMENATVPIIRTGQGICHVYIDKDADIGMGAKILYNAKCSRPSVCNAAECVLIHKDKLNDFLREAVPVLFQKRVELRCDEKSLAKLLAWEKEEKEKSTDAPDNFRKKNKDVSSNLESAGRALSGFSISDYISQGLIVPAKEDDWDSEYDDYILAIKTVESLDEAIDFITVHGTAHSEAIITENYLSAQRFLDEVDASSVYVNASTRFTDGGEFGLGAEIGISTQKLHARGPMGLRELTSTKYIIYGDGQVRE